MTAPTLLAALVLALSPPCGEDAGERPRPAGGSDTEFRRLFETGVSYDAFLDAARRRRTLWLRNTERAAPSPEALDRARGVGGSWRVLAVAVDGCSDSVSTLPYLAALVEAVDGLELRIVDSDAGRAVMEAHRTRDGRAATPTFVLLDAEWNEVGCFIERPAALTEWLREHGGALDAQARYEAKMAWYDTDAGQETVMQFVETLEAAAAGRRICR